MNLIESGLGKSKFQKRSKSFFSYTDFDVWYLYEFYSEVIKVECWISNLFLNEYFEVKRIRNIAYKECREIRMAIIAILTAAQQMYIISVGLVVFIRVYEDDRSLTGTEYRDDERERACWLGWKAVNCVLYPHSYSRPWYNAKQRGSMPNGEHDIGPGLKHTARAFLMAFYKSSKRKFLYISWKSSTVKLFKKYPCHTCIDSFLTTILRRLKINTTTLKIFQYFGFVIQ